MIELNSDKYFIRPSLFNLVELSLLADMYERYCTPSASVEQVSKESLAQTLLKMKAAEKNGRINVVLYEASPIGFYWEMDGKPVAMWIAPAHKNQGIEERISL